VKLGRKVRVLLRRTSRTEAIEDLPVDVFYGDVLDPASLRAAMQGCSSVFYSVVDARFWLTDTTPIYRNNVEGLSRCHLPTAQRGLPSASSGCCDERTTW
jgi:dihydroflavonol-4-reductase